MVISWLSYLLLGGGVKKLASISILTKPIFKELVTFFSFVVIIVNFFALNVNFSMRKGTL